MKSHRLIPLVLSFIAPIFAFAVTDSASLSALQGNVTTIVNGQEQPLELGATVGPATTMQTDMNSSAEFSFPNGNKILLGAGSALRIRTLDRAEGSGFYSYEIILLRGSVSGTAANGVESSSFIVTSLAGTANVAATTFNIRFTPASATQGTMDVIVGSGSASVLGSSAIQPVTIIAGNQATFSSGRPPVISTASPRNLLVAAGSSLAQTSAPATTLGFGQTPTSASDTPVAAPTVNGVNVSLINISPNGEGSVN